MASRSLIASLRNHAALPCRFTPGDVPCPEAWPDERDEWCGSCFARMVLEPVEALDAAVRDMLDFACGWCSDKLTPEERLARINVIGEAAISRV